MRQLTHRRRGGRGGERRAHHAARPVMKQLTAAKMDDPAEVECDKHALIHYVPVMKLFIGAVVKMAIKAPAIVL